MKKQEVLSSTNCQVLVDALIKGNDDFFKKIEKENEKYKINSAAENGQINIIDSRLIKELDEKKISFVQDYNIKKAGFNWKYGEYICETTFGRFLFIIKSDDALKRAFVKSNTNETPSEQEDRKYIDDYLEINQRKICQSTEPVEGLFEIPVSLFEDEKESQISLIADESFHEDVDYFFILVYKSFGKKLISVRLIFPNPITNERRLVQDLTEYIQSSKFNSNDNLQYNNFNIFPQESDDDISNFDERIIEAEESK
ncbi:spr1630 family ClpXP-sensitive toxin [Streptococcus suis]